MMDGNFRESIDSDDAVLDDEDTPVAPTRRNRNPYEGPEAEADAEAAGLRLPRQYFDMAIEGAGDKVSIVPRENLRCLGYAHAYADFGLHVLDSNTLDKNGKATGPDGDCKSPRGAGWSKEATTDHDKINDRWMGRGNYPPNDKGKVYDYASPDKMRGVCIVVPYGLPDNERYVIYDEDGDIGATSTADLVAEHGPLPQTVTAITGSGGRHLYFRTPNRVIRNSTSAVAPKIDIRGEGGQVSAPPTMSKYRKRYTWAPGRAPWEIEMAVAPKWLEDAMFYATKANQAGDASKKKGSAKPARKSNAGRKSEAHGFEEHLADIGDHEGGRGFNDPINRAALSWWSHRGVDADPEELRTVLRTRISEAERGPSRLNVKYDGDEWLKAAIEDARQHIAANAKPEPVSMTQDEVAAAITAAGIDKDSTDEDICDFLRQLPVMDGATRKRIIGALGHSIREPGATVFTPKEVANLWRGLDAEVSAADSTDSDEVPIVNDWDFDEMVAYGVDQIQAENSETPRLFLYAADLSRIEGAGTPKPRIKNLTEKQFSAEFNAMTTWRRLDTGSGGDTRLRGVSAPADVVSQIFGSEHTIYPELTGVVSTPIFALDGSMIITPGYHDSGVYYAPDPSLIIPPVSDVPTPEEVREATRLIIEEVLADFPLGGHTRADIMRIALDPESEGIPAVTNAVAMLLTLFIFNMFPNERATGFLFSKPDPGTGASLLVDLLSIIATGDVTPAQPLPPNKEEMAKSLLATMADGSRIFNFDNVDKTMDSGELASAMTAPKYKGRLLGKTQTVEIEVRALFAFSGNHASLSRELARRIVMVDLNANMANPEKRSGWRHADIGAWVRANRGQLVWACLTLVQNWVAGGMKPDTSVQINSFERWSGIINGILKAADLNGFDGNRDELRESTKSPGELAKDQFIFELASRYADGQPFRVASACDLIDGRGKVPSLIEICNRDNVVNDGCPIHLDGGGWDPDFGGYIENKAAGPFGRMMRKYAKEVHETKVDGKKRTVRFELGTADTGATQYVLRVEDAC